MHVIDERAFNLLQHIATSKYCTVDKAVQLLSCSERQIYYDLTKINDLLVSKDVLPIKISKGMIVTSQDMKKVIQNLDLSGQKFIICGNSKVWLAIMMIFCAKEPLGLNDFIYKFKASRNAILKDLKNLSLMAEHYGVNLIYTRKKGYHYIGTAKNIRTLVQIAIANQKESFMCMELIALAVDDQLFAQKHLLVERLLTNFVKVQNLSVIREYLQNVVYFICLLSYHYESDRYRPVVFRDHLWQQLPLYKAVHQLQSNLDERLIDELDYLFILILSTTLGNEIYFDIHKNEKRFLDSLAIELVNRFEAVTGCTFPHQEHVAANLVLHLRPAYFRLKYGIPVLNSNLDQIKKDYGEIFAICRLVLEPFASYLDTFIPDDEIAYIAMYFLAMLDSPRTDKLRKRAVIVCQNGIASSAMMSSQLTKMFPELIFLAPCNISQFEQLNSDSYEVIFSTRDDLIVNDSKYFFVMPPILTPDEKLALVEEVYTTAFGLTTDNRVTVSSLLGIIEEYATIHQVDALILALSNHLSKKRHLKRKDGLPVLKDLLTAETIRFAEGATDWEDAIWMGAKPLLENASIDDIYVEAIISNIKKNGPYIVICPKVAIPHASNKNGVYQLGMSYLRLEREVQVLDQPDRAVNVLITLAAIDDKTHLKALAQLSNLLSDTKLREQLLGCSNCAEVLKVIELASEQ